VSRTMTLPEGCAGLTMSDGRRYDADRRGRVEVADRHVDDIRSHYGALGLIDVADPKVLGTKATAWCLSCRPTRAWQVWTTHCRVCGNPTTSNGEQS